MVNVSEVVDSYVAVWNEADSKERRRRIRSVWVPDGTTCFSLLDARGYEAIEGRVTGSWDKWISEGKHIFKPKYATCHHDVVKFDWVLVTVPDGAVQASGLSFLLLNDEGRIKHDYQFNPALNDSTELVQLYLAVLNEPDASLRRKRISELWAPDGSLVTETTTINGHDAIAAEAAQAHDASVAKGLESSPADRSHGHHNLMRFVWHMRAKESARVAAAGSELLILDEGGRVRCDYRFKASVQAYR